MVKNVYLAVRAVHIRKPGISELVRNNGTAYVAEWFARGTGTKLYSSKRCYTTGEAETLAHKWLAKRNAPRDPAASAWLGEPTTYLDTTTTKA